MNWQSDALTALKQDVPFFVRPAVRRRVESMAVEAGRTDVCLDFYREAKASMGPKYSDSGLIQFTAVQLRCR